MLVDACQRQGRAVVCRDAAPAHPLRLERADVDDGEAALRGLGEPAAAPLAPDRTTDAGVFESDPTRVPALYRDLVGWDAFDAALDELAALAREHGFEVMFVVFEPDGVGGPLRDGRRRRALAEAARRGFTIVDVGALQAEWMRQRNVENFYKSGLTLTAIDPHPSTLSHWLAAELLLQKLRTR